MRSSYPIASIQKNDRLKYYQALDQADSGKNQSIVRIVAQAVERTLNIYLKAFVKSSPQTDLLRLSDIANQTEFSAKYLNLLARKGILKAQKEGRNWLSSLKAVEDYKKSRLRKRGE